MEVVPLEPDEEAPADEEVKVVYLTEGSQLGYLPGEASEAIGW
jgi:hypothetical protein